MRKIGLRLISASLSLLLICMTGCNSTNGSSDNKSTNTMDGMNGKAAREEATIANVKQSGGSIHIIAAGDNMIQNGVLNAATANADGEQQYNFTPCYEDAKSIISSGDIKIINQSSLICDNENIAVSGDNYNLNSPPEVGNALIDTGFNVVSIGNRHLLDNGTGGLESCLNYWDKMKSNYYGLITYGAYKNETDMNDIRVCDINGLKVAFLSYTDSIANSDFLNDSDLEVVLLSDEEKVKSQIEAANDVADAVIISAHWGTEDTFDVADEVKQQAQNMVDWGADVILGVHPHVPQTMEYLTRQDGSQGFVFYSLGNFISSQTYNINLVGEVADFNIKVDPKGNTTIEDIQVRPVITHFEGTDFSNLKVIPYRDYTEELCNTHGLPQISSNANYADWNMEKIKEIIDTGIPEEYQKLD